jgi:histidinol-phosphatase (PHP family)
MIATFHNHSAWSDGTPSFAEIYGFAESAGVDILGLSDHLCIYPDGTVPDYSLAPSQIAQYLADVLSFRDRGNIEVRVGLEFDWFEGHKELLAPVVERIPLDYRIGAIHHVEMHQFDTDASFWGSKTAEEQDAIYIKYWKLVREMADSRLFDIAAHLDLPKKFGFYPNSDIGWVIDEAIGSIKDAGMVVELNTAGFRMPCNDGYPSLDILQRCHRRDIPVTLSSDGHIPEHILFEFGRGLAILKEAGFTSITRFRDGDRWFEPLEDAIKTAPVA